VLVAHQPIVAVLHAAGVVPWEAYAMRPTQPLGVPAVASAAFFGGIWAVLLAPFCRDRAAHRVRWGRTVALFALLPTAVGVVLTLVGHGYGSGAAGPVAAILAGLAANAAFGVVAMVMANAASRRPM
jgi:hypothetical protein